MSPYEIRRRALLAAAKVSFSFAALGCGAADVPSAPEIEQRSGTPVCEQNDGRCGGSVGQPGSAGHQGDAAGAGGEGGSSLLPGGAGAGGAEEGGAGAGGQAGQAGGEGCGTDTEVPYDAAQVQCCMDRISALFPEPFMTPPETLSGEDTACCRVLVQSSDWSFDHPDEAAPKIPWELANNCCYYPDITQMGPTCTPWGPPSPPEMIPGLSGDFSWLGEAA